jgi:hypothetical protein
MPFTRDQFFDLFLVYNAQVAPVIAALWLLSLVAVLQHLRGELRPRTAAGLLAVHWAWSGAVYHAVYFTRINPAAWLFAGMFIAQSLALLWYASANRRAAPVARKHGVVRAGAADVFLVASLAYPALVLLTGHSASRAPLFAVPCPTTLLTAGLLLALGPRAPRWLAVIPILWAGIGGSAALLFGVMPDMLLIAAGIALVVWVWRPSPGRQALAHASR